MENQKNIFIAIGVTILVLFGWQYYMNTKYPNLGKKAQAVKAKKVETPVVAKDPKKIAPVAMADPVATPLIDVVEQNYTLENELYKVIFSNIGGSIKEITMKGTQFVAKGHNISIIKEENKQRYPLSFSINQGEEMILGNTYPFQRISSQDDEITFLYQGKGLSITKKYKIIKEDYRIQLSVVFKNNNKKDYLFTKRIVLGSIFDKDAERSMLIGESGKRHFYAEEGDDFEWVDHDDIKDKVTTKKLLFAGIDDLYFTSLIKLNQPDRFELDMELKDKTRFYMYLNSDTFRVPAGKSLKFSYELYNGPKIAQKLDHFGAIDAIDYGVVAMVSKLILLGILFFYNLLGNYGFALILLTIVIKSVLYPITKSSYISMYKMKALKPEMDKLRQKYGNDREKIGRETMALYKTNGVNPLGGCLPMILQMPIWFGLYRAIQNSVELYNAPFMLWIQDLSAKDPYYILPVTLGGLMFVQQKLSSGGMEEMQAKVMLYTMPLLFSFLMMNLPAGLVLYIWVNTLITIIQQNYITSKQKKLNAVAGMNKGAKAIKGRKV